MRTRSFKLATSVSSGLVGQALTFVAPILVLPALLRYLGPIEFGLWITAVSLNAALSFLDLGIYSNLLTGLAKAYATQDLAVARRLIATSYAVLGGIAVASLVVLFIIAFFCSDLSPIAAVVVAAFFISLPAAIAYRSLYAMGKIVQSNLLQASGAILSVIVCYLAIHARPDQAWVVVAAHAGAPLALMVAASIAFFFVHPELQFRLGDITLANATALIRSSSSFLALAVFTAIGQNCDLMIISATVGPAEAAEYGPPMRLGGALALVVSQLFLPLWSFHGAALARGENAWVRQVSKKMSLRGAGAVLVLGLTLTISSDWIIELWMGRFFLNQAVVLAGLTAFATVVSYTAPYNMVLNAQGMARAQLMPWALFVATTIPAKVAASYLGYAAFLPMISCACYVALVTPVVLGRAERSLSS